MRPIYLFLWSPSLSRMNVWEISLDNDQWLAFKRTAAVLYKLFIGLFVSPIPSHPVSHSDRKDNSSWCPTEDVLQYTNTKRTNTNIYKRYTLFVVTCLFILDGEMNSTEIQMTIQRSASWATIVKLPHFKCQLSVLFNLPAGLNPQVNNRLNIFSFWQKSSSKQVKGHWQKII